MCGGIIKTTIGLLILIGISTSCSWIPERDNSRDPESQFYQEPPPPNFAPVIDTVSMYTECRGHVQGNVCTFTVLAEISDSNNNLDFHHVSVQILLLDSSLFELGNMSYDAELESFSLFKTQEEFEGNSISQFVGRPVVVTAQDHEGLTDGASLLFEEPLDRPPLPIHPLNNDVVPTQHPTLGWAYWGDTTSTQTFNVAVYLQGFIVAWDTIGMLASDTMVVVGAELLPSNADPQLFYTWTLTVVSEQGNRITTTPINFSVVIPDTLRNDDRIR